MEETFSSLVCFQPPPPFQSQFTLCSLQDSNERGRALPPAARGLSSASTGVKPCVCTGGRGRTYTQNAACASSYTAVHASPRAGASLFLDGCQR